MPFLFENAMLWSSLFVIFLKCFSSQETHYKLSPDQTEFSSFSRQLPSQNAPKTDHLPQVVQQEHHSLWSMTPLFIIKIQILAFPWQNILLWVWFELEQLSCRFLRKWASNGNGGNPLTAGGLMAATKNTLTDYSNTNTYFKVPARSSSIFLMLLLIIGHPVLWHLIFVS